MSESHAPRFQIHVADTGSTQTVALADTYTKVDQFPSSANMEEGFTWATATNRVTCNNYGTFMLMLKVAFSMGTDDGLVEWDGVIYKNGTAVAHLRDFDKVIGDDQQGKLCIVGFIELDKDDYLEFFVRTDEADKEFNAHYITWDIVMLPGANG